MIINLDPILTEISDNFEMNECVIRLNAQEQTIVNSILWAVQDSFLDYLDAKKDIDESVGDFFISALEKINNA